MKILITTDFFSPTVNGVVTSTVNLRKGLTERGHEVRILTLQQKEKSSEEGVWYLPSVGLDAFVAPTVRFRMGLPTSVLREVLEWKPDIVHSQCEFCTFGPARKIATKAKVPLVNTYHTMYEDYARYLFRFSNRFGRYAAKKFTQKRLSMVDAVVVPTKKTQELLLRYGVRTPVSVIPSGLDLARFREVRHGEFYEKVRNLAAGRKSILYIGRLAKEKNIGELIGYFRTFDDPNLVFFIAGYGPLQKELEQQASDLQGRVIFLGTVPPEQVPECYAAADIFVSASTTETQGLTYFEALSCGTPVLCREDDCIRGVVEDGKNGYLFRDYQSFANGLHCLTEGDLSSMSEACRAAAEEFSLEKFAERAEKLYLGLTEKKR